MAPEPGLPVQLLGTQFPPQSPTRLRAALRKEQASEVAPADPSHLDLLRADWMEGHGLHAFSFSMASGEAQDRLPCHVLLALPDKPRTGRRAL